MTCEYGVERVAGKQLHVMQEALFFRRAAAPGILDDDLAAVGERKA